MNIGPASLLNLLKAPTASATAREDRLAAAAEAKLRDAKAAAETLKQRNSQASEERKAIARQKIEQLKARLQMLKAMASVDPQGTARIAAQLARELGSAVKAYAAAGGVTSGLDTGGVPAAAAATGTPAEGQGDAAATGIEGAPVEVKAEGQASTGEAPAEAKDGEAPKPANPYQQTIDQQKAQAAEMSRRSGEKQADSEFMLEVRKLAAEIKALVRQATDQTRAGDDKALSPDEADQLDKAVAAMDREIADAGADLTGGGISLLV